jgi:hypothetical protein
MTTVLYWVEVETVVTSVVTGRAVVPTPMV